MSSSFVMVHLVGFSLVCFMEVAFPDSLWVSRVFSQLFSGDDIRLFPILVCFIAGQYVVLFRRMMVSHNAVSVVVILYESPRW